MFPKAQVKVAPEEMGPKGRAWRGRNRNNSLGERERCPSIKKMMGFGWFLPMKGRNTPLAVP